MTGLEFNTASSDIPVYPAAADLRVRRRAREARLERDARARRTRGARGGRGAARTLNRYPDPDEVAAAQRASPTAPASRRAGSPWATAPARSCWPPPRRMLEPGAEIVYAWPSFSMYPHLAAMTGARAIDGAARRRRRARPRGDGHARSRPRRGIVLVCNPNNPTATALPLASDRRLRRRAAAPRRA